MKKSRYPEIKKVDGKIVCRGCHGPVPKGRQTWCSNKCYRAHCPQMVIFEVKARDKGVCQICKESIEVLYQRWEESRPADVNWLQHRNTPVYEAYQKACEAHANARVIAEYDHIIPFSKGGKTILENMRTLCTPCHKKVTREFAAERALERKAKVPLEPELKLE